MPAKRLTAAGRTPVAAANGNFWVVSSQTPDGKVFSGITLQPACATA